MNDFADKVFHEVVDLPAGARSRHVAEHRTDDGTQREIEALLAFDRNASALLVHDVGRAAGRALPQLEAVGRRCGPIGC